MTTETNLPTASEFKSNLDHVLASKARIMENFKKSLKTPSMEQAVATAKGNFDISGITAQTCEAIAKHANVDMEEIKKGVDSFGGPDVFTIMPVLTERFGYALQSEAEINEALTLFPIATVSNDRAQWYSFDSKDTNRVDEGWMAPGDGTTGIKLKQSTKQYTTRLRGKHVSMTEEFMARARNEGGFGTVGADDIANAVLAQWVSLTRVKAYVDILFDSSATGFSAVAANNGGRWDVAGNYVKDIAAAARAIRVSSFGTISKRDLTLAMTLEDWEDVMFNETIEDLIAAGGSVGAPAVMTPDAFAALCGIKRVVLVDVYNTVGKETEDGTGGTFEAMVDNQTAVLFYDNPTPTGAFVNSAVANFAYTGLAGLNGQGIRSYPFNPTMETVRGDAIAVNVYDGPTMTNKAYGRRITGITAN